MSFIVNINDACSVIESKLTVLILTVSFMLAANVTAKVFNANIIGVCCGS